MLQNTKTTLSYLVNDNIRKVETVLSRIEGVAVGILILIEKGLIPPSNLESYVQDILRQHPEIESIYLAYEDDDNLPQTSSRGYYLDMGRFRVLDLRAAGIDYQIRDWYQIPFLTATDYWSEPWFDADGKRLMISSYSLPIMSPDEDRVIGIIRLDIALSALQRRVAGSDRHHIGNTLLISCSGRIVVHPDDDKLLNETIFSLAEENNDTHLRSIGKEMLAGKTRFVKLRNPVNEEPQWIYYAPLPLNSWALGIIFDEKEIFRDLDTLLLILTLFMIGGFLAIAVIISVIVWKINKPLQHLTAAANSIGQGDFETEVRLPENFNEIRYLAQGISNMRDSLKDYMNNLLQTTEEKNRIQSDLRIASLVQQNLIPNNNDMSRMFPGLKVYGIVEPAKEIGGDLYDYFRLDDKRFCFVIADVLGKGMVAAMTMTVVNTLIRTKARSASSIKELLSDINRYLCDTQSDANFVTMIIGFIDLSSGIMEYCNAGHVPMYLRKRNRHLMKFSETQSTALGILADIDFNTRIMQLDLGDTIILFTDGITETMSKAEDFFGEVRLEELIAGLQNPEPETIVKAILNSVRKFADRDRQADDTTILVIEYVRPAVKR